MRTVQIRKVMGTAGLAGLLAVVAAAGSGCGGGESPDLVATLADYSIALSAATVPAGELTVKAVNKGTTVHEVVFVRTDLPEDKLPVVDNKVDEDQVEVVDEIEEFSAGKSRTATFDLPPGRYVLICNITAHYGLGMHTVLTVEQASATGGRRRQLPGRLREP